MRKLRMLALFLLFLPFVAKAGEPQPFSIWLDVRSVVYQVNVEEPYVEVAVYSAAGGDPLFQGFTNGYGWLDLGLFAELAQSLRVEVKRDRVDGGMQHTLPLVRSDDVLVGARQQLHCSATYDYDEGVNEVDCSCW